MRLFWSLVTPHVSAYELERMPDALKEPAPIGAVACPHCLLCGSEGRFIHLNLHDRLFGAYGSWSLKRCSNADCGLAWLDPMPRPEEIGKAYANYYTHAPSSPQAVVENPTGLGRRFYRVMKNGYLASRYNYQVGSGTAFSQAAAVLMWLLPTKRARLDSEVRRLRAVPGGRLLDVGCGSGEWLLWMRTLGWEVEGVDFDERAVKTANELGLKVRFGSLEQQKFPAESFDAVTMSHVIEHVPDPIQTLSECARILRPGGRLFIWTPNSSSLGCRVFGKHWRGLEPPRHLHLFSPRSMRSLLHKAGLNDVSIRTRNLPIVLRHSMELWLKDSGKSRNPVLKVGAGAATAGLALAEWGVLLINSAAGELIEVHATKAR